MGEVIEFRQKPSTESFVRALPHEGFSDEQLEQARSLIIATDLPPDNITQLERRPNDPNDEESKDTIASMDIAGEKVGRLTIFDLIDELPPEKRAGTVVHEIGHSLRSSLKENTRFYGGEEKREEAEARSFRMAEMSLLSNTFLNGYQAKLAGRLSKGKIDFGRYREESEAIALELGMTNRAKLEQVEAAQHAKIARLQNAGRLSENYQPVNLVSHNGQPDGIDIHLIALLNGVSNVEELEQHVTDFKAKIYSGENLELAMQRTEETGAPVDIRKQHVGELAVAA